MKLEVIPWDDPTEPSEEILRQRLEREGFAVWRWRDGPGADYQPHSHDHDESLWVVDGKITFGVEGREYPLARGDRLMLPKGTVHTARAGSGGATYLIGEKQS